MSRIDSIEETFRGLAMYLATGKGSLPIGPRPADPLHRPQYLFVPDLPDAPWIDPAGFPWVAEIEAGFPAVAEELAGLLAQPGAFASYAQPGRPTLHDAGDWTMFYLTSPSTFQVIEEHRARAPRTYELLRRVPRLDPGFVAFSCLAPGTHVIPHCGHTNAKLRCHLGIQIPPGCRIRVGSEIRTWSEGRCLLFTDSYEHEVWHDGDAPRYVLTFDVFHPELSDEEVARIELWQRRLAGA